MFFMLMIRSIIFYPVYILIVIVWASLMFLSAPVTSVNNRLYICYAFSKVYEKWLYLCCGVKIFYSYEVSLPQEQNYIIMANHESSWDAYGMTVLRRPSVTVLKRELLRIPIFGWALTLIKPISLNRANLVQSMKRIYSQGQEKLKQGYNLVIFPQGTRGTLPNIIPFKNSAINLSLASGYPILPIAHNSGELLPVGKFLKRPGNLNVIIGSPLEPNNHSKEEFTKLVMDKMHELLKRAHNSPIKFQQ